MIEINNQTEYNIDLDKLKKNVQEFLVYKKKEDKNVSLAIVGDEMIHELNKKYRQKDKVTDVLSFCYENDDLGEIVISYPQIRRQAKEFSHTEEEELIYIMVHGLLHLIGMTDDTEAGALEMKKEGDKFIKLCSK